MEKIVFETMMKDFMGKIANLCANEGTKLTDSLKLLPPTPESLVITNASKEFWTAFTKIANDLNAQLQEHQL